jgi:hypothetical protein
MDATQRHTPSWTWHDDVDPTGPVIRLLAHPLFPRAARAMATNMLAAEHDPALAAVFKDAGRYVTAMWTIYLHASGGITLPQLKEVCAASGFTSAGRARLLLQFLQHIGYVEASPESRHREATQYIATPTFLSTWQTHLRAALLAAALVEPAIFTLIDRMDQPGVFEGFLRIQASRLHRLSQGMVEAPPFQRIFLHRYAGLQIISMLLVSGDHRDFPPAEPLPISLKLTAARFGVSYMHVRRLLHDAVQEGLLHYEATGTVTLTEDTRETIRFFYAVQLAELVASATEMLATLEPPARTTSFRRLAMIGAP